MPEMTIDTCSLLKEIESVFPFVDMPEGNDLVFHKNGCFECDDLQNDLEDYRNKEITSEAIRLVHQELSSLSAKGWRWVLPHYLRFCLTTEAEYNRMETEFLIYSLRPLLEFQKDTLLRLSLLDKDQINCLIHFLMWCENKQHWKEYCLEDIRKAKSFLSSINS
ncbi:MAG: hypothetical protein QX199_20000 [Methylococcaceae bacterium]